MRKLSLLSHSPHVILNDWPVALLPTSLAFDVLSQTTKKREMDNTGYYLGIAGILTGAVAAVTGLADYLLIRKEERQLKGTANIHALLNTFAMGAMGASLYLRRGRGGQSTATSLLLSGIANSAALVSAWYGGTMVYHLGMRVEGKSNPEDHARPLKVPGEDRAVHGLEALAERFAPTEATIH